MCRLLSSRENMSIRHSIGYNISIIIPMSMRRAVWLVASLFYLSINNWIRISMQIPAQPIKLLVIDIDGTLLDQHRKITPRTQIASGRAGCWYYCDAGHGQALLQ